MEKTINLHRYQTEAFYAKERFVAVISGIQGGKTFTGALWSRTESDKNPNGTGLICAPTYKILQQSTLPKFFEINQDLQKYYKKGDSVIEVPNRGKIYIRSTENPNTLEGMTLSWCWADEAGQMSVEAWINIQGRLSILQGRCFITTTPYYFNWLATDFLEQFRKNNPDYRVVQFTSVDNPYFPKEEYERVKTVMDKRVFERRYMGLFTKMEGLVYDDFNYNLHTFLEAPKTFNNIVAGIDWGYTAPASITIIGDVDGIFYEIDEFYGSKKTTAELVEIAKNLRDRYKVNRFYADSAEPDRIEEFRRSGLYVLEANKDIEFGTNKVRQLIKEGRFKVGRNCKYTLDEIEHYHYPETKEGQEEKEQPMKIDDHAMDSIRYALATFQPLIIRPKPRDHFNERMRVKNKQKNYIRMA